MTEFSKRSSLENAHSLETPLNEQKPFQKFLAIIGSVRFLVDPTRNISLVKAGYL